MEQTPQHQPLTPGVQQGVGKELEPFDTEKGTIRFTPGKSLPASLVKKIVKARIAEETVR